MTALERKEHTEKILATRGIVIRDQLPPLEEEENIVLRSPQEIAVRILILSYLNCIASQPNRTPQIVSFLKQEELWENASLTERALFEKSDLSEEDLAAIAWRVEAIWLLLWIIKKVEVLDLPEKEIDAYEIFEHIPGFMEPPHEFIREATIRFKSEILDQSDLIFRLTWAIRQSQMEGAHNLPLSEAIAYERFNAINWVTRIREQWDDA